jgi:hypothetical protein
MVQNRAFLKERGGRGCALLLILSLGLIFSSIPTLVTGQKSFASNSNQAHLTLGGFWTRYVLSGGWGISIGYLRSKMEISIGGERNIYTGAGAVAGRYYFGDSRKIVRPFLGGRAAYYYDSQRLGQRPSHSLNLHAAIGIKIMSRKNCWMQGQLGLGYSGFFRSDGKPIFVPTWIPTRMLQVGVGYDMPLRRRNEGVAPETDLLAFLPALTGKFSLLLHTGLQINYLAPPSFERFTAGLAYDVHPRLGLTLRHQAVRTINGLKYGKSLIGVRWMPGDGSGLRWVGSLELGHWGSALNFRSPIGAFGVMVGQHLQYPIFTGIAVDIGLQYALLKAPQPLQPASSDFETSLGLVIRPGAWRKR